MIFLSLLFLTTTFQELQGPALLESEACALCHSNAERARAMRTSSGDGIAPYDLWQSTMMANSARDPLWRAFVSAEVAATPSRQREIEEKCLSCHAPMAHQIGLEDHGTGSLMHLLECDSDLGQAAQDGVSCTVCHGITEDGLGSDESFSGHFKLDPKRRMFGPHKDPMAMPMQRHTGFTPAYSDHVTQSKLCATCHTLETETLRADGTLAGSTLIEQAPYLEWRNSVFSNESFDGTAHERTAPGVACQGCHVPIRDSMGEALHTPIARNPRGGDFGFINPREPVGLHRFIGGNTLLLSIFRDHSKDLNVDASPEAFQATLESTRAQLQQRSARVEIRDVRWNERRFAFRVDVTNLTGHKLPTAHPTRRAWLEVIVRDEEGAMVFASGQTDEKGRIVDDHSTPLPSELAGGPTASHRDRVNSTQEVPTYEAIMSDSEGETTYTLMRGASWKKDDRLLPRGWDPLAKDALKTAPVGIDGDTNFVGGRDSVFYELPIEEGRAKRIEVRLLYQTLGARWAAELFQWETKEVHRFREFYDQADLTPETLAHDTWNH